MCVDGNADAHMDAEGTPINFLNVVAGYILMHIPSNFVQVHNAFSLRYKRIEKFHNANLFEMTICLDADLPSQMHLYTSLHDTTTYS
jgi:hypothetical protein